MRTFAANVMIAAWSFWLRPRTRKVIAVFASASGRPPMLPLVSSTKASARGETSDARSTEAFCWTPFSLTSSCAEPRPRTGFPTASFTAATTRIWGKSDASTSLTTMRTPSSAAAGDATTRGAAWATVTHAARSSRRTRSDIDARKTLQNDEAGDDHGDAPDERHAQRARREERSNIVGADQVEARGRSDWQQREDVRRVALLRREALDVA